MRSGRQHGVLGWAAAVVAAAGLASCAGGGDKAKAGAEADAGLGHLNSAGGEQVPPAPPVPGTGGAGARPRTLAEQVEQSAIDLQRVLSEQGTGSGGSAAASPATAPPPERRGARETVTKAADAVAAPGGDAAVPLAGAGAAAPTNGADIKATEPSGPAGPVSPQERIDRSAAELAAAIQDRGSMGYAEALVLACLESVRPGISQAVTGGAELSTEESRALEAIRRLIGGLCGMGKTAQPEAVAELLGAARESVAPAPRLRISSAALCRSVQGYGRYAPFTTTAFLAGRAQQVIVYVEVDRFGYRPARVGEGGSGEGGGALWVVELSQEINLYTEADSTLQLRVPEETVVDASRNKVRDFYLVQRITLPETLSVGSYRLKVRMRDRVTGAEDEAILPLSVVADAGLAGK